MVRVDKIANSIINNILCPLIDNAIWVALIAFIGISALKAYGAWYYIQYPVVANYFWNETLAMYESTYLSPQGRWWDVVGFVWYFIVGGKWYFTVWWLISGIYLVLRTDSWKLCIDTSGGKE